METSREIKEQIDALAIEAKAIVEVCKRDNREMRDDEQQRFDEITDKELPQLKEKLATAIKRDNAIEDLAREKSRHDKLDDINQMLADSSGGSNQLQLPVSGREVATEPARPANHYYRMGKLKAFTNEADAYNAGMWLRAVVSREFNRDDTKALQHVHRLGWPLTNAATEGSGTAGGYVVPSPMSSAIIDVRERVGVMRSLLRMMPMTSNTLEMAKRTGGLTVYYPGETSAITTSDKSWGQIELIAKRRAVAHQISQDLQDDALIAIVDDAVNEMGYALALKEDDEAINGDASSAYGGVQGLLNQLGAAGTHDADTGHDTWPELDLTDVTGMMAKLPDEYHIMPAWLCSSAFYYSVMLRLEAAAGGNTITSLQSGDTGRRMFLGYPVFTTNRMPTASAASTVCALFGTFSMGAILGERTGIRIGRSEEYKFLEDMLTLKATVRYDIKVHSGGDASDAGAYVGLKTAA